MEIPPSNPAKTEQMYSFADIPAEIEKFKELKEYDDIAKRCGELWQTILPQISTQQGRVFGARLLHAYGNHVYAKTPAGKDGFVLCLRANLLAAALLLPESAAKMPSWNGLSIPDLDLSKDPFFSEITEATTQSGFVSAASDFLRTATEENRFLFTQLLTKAFYCFYNIDEYYQDDFYDRPETWKENTPEIAAAKENEKRLQNLHAVCLKYYEGEGGKTLHPKDFADFVYNTWYPISLMKAPGEIAKAIAEHQKKMLEADPSPERKRNGANFYSAVWSWFGKRTKQDVDEKVLSWFNQMEEYEKEIPPEPLTFNRANQCSNRAAIRLRIFEKPSTGPEEKRRLLQEAAHWNQFAMDYVTQELAHQSLHQYAFGWLWRQVQIDRLFYRQICQTIAEQPSPEKRLPMLGEAEQHLTESRRIFQIFLSCPDAVKISSYPGVDARGSAQLSCLEAHLYLAKFTFAKESEDAQSWLQQARLCSEKTMAFLEKMDPAQLPEEAYEWIAIRLLVLSEFPGDPTLKEEALKRWQFLEQHLPQLEWDAQRMPLIQSLEQGGA